MPKRDIPLVKGEIYHIFNRGVARQPTYFNKRDYRRFAQCLEYYRFKNVPCKLSRTLRIPETDRNEVYSKLENENDLLVEIISYCLMPNHYHLLLKQVEDDGISRFIKLLIDSYTRYTNTRYDRVGPLYQGQFKAVHIETDEQLLHVSRYIHLNPVTAHLIKEQQLATYEWSSYPSIILLEKSFINFSGILGHFSTIDSYRDFVLDFAGYSKELHKVKHLLLEK